MISAIRVHEFTMRSADDRDDFRVPRNQPREISAATPAANCHGINISPRSAATIAECKYAAGSMSWSFAVSTSVYSVAATSVPRRDFPLCQRA